jgi:hypothetical protein
VAAQDPDHGPLAVGDACQKVASVSVPRQTMLWTCGIAVQGDYNCGGGVRALPAQPHMSLALQLHDVHSLSTRSNLKCWH